MGRVRRQAYPRGRADPDARRSPRADHQRPVVRGRPHAGGNWRARRRGLVRAGIRRQWVPSLEEALAACRSSASESTWSGKLARDGRGYLERCSTSWRRTGRRLCRPLLISSFAHACLAVARERAPDLPRGYLLPQAAARLGGRARAVWMRDPAYRSPAHPRGAARRAAGGRRAGPALHGQRSQACPQAPGAGGDGGLHRPGRPRRSTSCRERHRSAGRRKPEQEGRWPGARSM